MLCIAGSGLYALYISLQLLQAVYIELLAIITPNSRSPGDIVSYTCTYGGLKGGGTL